MVNTLGEDVYAAPIYGKSERFCPGLKDNLIHLKILTALSGKTSIRKCSEKYSDLIPTKIKRV